MAPQLARQDVKAPFQRKPKHIARAQKLWCQQHPEEPYDTLATPRWQNMKLASTVTTASGLDLMAAIKRQQSYPYQASLHTNAHRRACDACATSTLHVQGGRLWGWLLACT